MNSEMDWIHCNECYNQPSGGTSFLLTSCGHMFCKPCHDRDSQNEKCKMCSSVFKSILLVPDMKSEVKEYFSEPDEILRKLIDVMDFQKQHRVRLITHWVSLNKKYQNAKSEIKRLSLLVERVHGDLKELSKQNKMLKSALNSQNCRNPKLYSPFAEISTPIPVFAHSSSKICSTPRRQTISSRQNFESSLVTPYRVSRTRTGTGCSSNESERRTNILTPPSTINSHS